MPICVDKKCYMINQTLVLKDGRTLGYAEAVSIVRQEYFVLFV